MRKPVVIFVTGNLLLITTIRLHSPDLHRSAAHRVEVDVFAVGAILWPIIQPFSSGDPDFFATFCGYSVDVKFPIPLRSVDQELAVGDQPWR
jgi:hypothetical protein